MSYNWKLEMIECKIFDAEIIMLVIPSIKDKTKDKITFLDYILHIIHILL